MKKFLIPLFSLILLTTGIAQAVEMGPITPLIEAEAEEAETWERATAPLHHYVAKDYSEERGEPKIAASAAQTADTHGSVNRRYKTLPYNFPHIDVLLQEEGIGEGYLFLSTFNWRDFPNSDPYLLILDNNGEPVYAGRSESGQLITDFKPQPNGRLSYFDRARGHYVLLDNSYTEIGIIEAGNGYPTDLHELIITEEEHIILMIYHDRPLAADEFVAGMNREAVVTDLILQELDAAGNVIFEWNSRDHFEITDTVIDMSGATLDYAHGNSIDVDFDGNWLVSSRHMDEVTKINRQTGEIIWRLGGKKSDFTFSSPDDLFYHQHDARRLPNGNLLLFDNGALAARTTSRAVEYALDEENFTASVVQTVAREPANFSIAMGSASRLPNGNTLVGWGSGYPAVTEFRPDGTKAFELALDAPLVSYRAYRNPWVGRPTTPPTLITEPVPGGVELTMSWNGATGISGYEIYGTSKTGEEELILFAPKTGFETTIFIPQSRLKETPKMRMMPIDTEQNRTLYSEQVTVQTEQLFIPLMLVDQATAAVPAISEPTAFFRPDLEQEHIYYFGNDHQIVELWHRPDTGWRQNRIGALTSAPQGIGNPSAYLTTGSSDETTQHILYRGIDGQLHELWNRRDVGWQHKPLGLDTGAPPAASDPFGYAWGANRSQHVVYRGFDDHIYLLEKRVGDPAWQLSDLTALTGAVAANGRPHAYSWEGTHSQHVVYRGRDGQIHELWHMPDRGWHHKNLGAELDAQTALGDPVGIGLAQRQIVAYRGTDGHLHEMHKAADAAWTYYGPQQSDVSRLVAGPLSIGRTKAGYSITYRATDNQIYHTSFRFEALETEAGESVPTAVKEPVISGTDLFFIRPINVSGRANLIIYRGQKGELVRIFYDPSSGEQIEQVVSRFDQP